MKNWNQYHDYGKISKESEGSIKKRKPKKNKKCWCEGLDITTQKYAVIVNNRSGREELLKLIFCPECGRWL
jgi:hypothetical protein